MPRVCTVCTHAERDAIVDAFIAGTAKRRIAAQFGVSEQALRRHVREHLPALLALARDAERTARADTVLDRLEAYRSAQRRSRNVWRAATSTMRSSPPSGRCAATWS
jgi:hypothetical protein